MPRAASRQAVALTLRGAVALLGEALAVLDALPDDDAAGAQATIAGARARLRVLAARFGQPVPRQVTNYLDVADNVVAGAPDFAGDAGAADA